MAAPAALCATSAIASITGAEIAEIIAASGIAISTIIAVLKGYDVKYKCSSNVLILERKN